MSHQSKLADVCPERRAKALPPFNALRERRVAIIAADPATLEGLCTLLSGWGCESIAGNSANRIIHGCLGRQPDLILADYHLEEGRNGMGEVIALCLHFNRNIPAGLISEDCSRETREAIESSGYPLLDKPIVEYRLRALVQTLVTQTTPSLFG